MERRPRFPGVGRVYRWRGRKGGFMAISKRLHTNLVTESLPEQRPNEPIIS